MRPVENEGGLLDRCKLTGNLLRDKRREVSHVAILYCVLDAYFARHGNARASIRFIEKEMGFSRPTVVKATRDLVAWGYFTKLQGIGTRPSEFAPNWASGKADLTTTSGKVDLTASGKADLTTTGASGKADLTESYLRSPLTSGLTVSRTASGGTHAAASGRAAPCLPASRDPERATDEFGELWNSYPRRFDKPKARAAYDKLKPDSELACRLVCAAKELADHHQRLSTDKKWIPTLANWLAGERYDEDLPAVYENTKEAAMAKARDRSPKADRQDETAVGKHGHNIPRGIHVLTIKSAQELGSPFSDLAIRLVLEDDTGREYEHTFWPCNSDNALAEAGMRINSEIMRTVNNGYACGTDLFVDKTILAHVSPVGAIKYSAAA